ncbi:hypothetical protein [Paenibacillus taichungensis]|uniref:hypothetical protein n=1 Tax=Paenibacillus taichungensis TaxID=484184 RepID=UPI0035E209DD
MDLKRKKLTVGVIMMLFIFVLTGCDQLVLKTSVQPPVITFDGTEVILGETKLKTLIDGGFTRVINSTTDHLVGSSLPGMAFNHHLLYVTKGEEPKYAGLSLLNEDKNEQPLEDCVIYSINYWMYLRGTSIVYPDILINQVNYRGYTMDQVKVAMEGKEIVSDDSGFLMLIDGDYRYTFKFDDSGEVVTIDIEMEFPKHFSN